MIKFSQDIVPLSDLKINPGRIIRQVNGNRRPVLITHRGRGVAIIQDLEEFESLMEELAQLRAIVHHNHPFSS